MNLIQFLDQNNETRVAIVRDSQKVEVLNQVGSVYELAQLAIKTASKLADLATKYASAELLDYQKLLDDGRILAPLHHPDPAHTLVAGTGLTHLGSADTRAAMHSKIQGKESELTDSMKMFRMGVEGGKPPKGQPGVQPEWFYKGDGNIVVAPGKAIQSPDFALDIGDEAEIVGLYIIGDDGKTYRIGFALGNEYSDHKTEKINYLYLAHSKLRPCSFGPEILLGDLPNDVKGMSRILRDGKVFWEKEFLSGEANMSHTIANLEYHHFKYSAFLQPGDVHVHFFGTGTLSFGDGIETQEGDVFELESNIFGKPLRNKIEIEKSVTDFDAPVIQL